MKSSVRGISWLLVLLCTIVGSAQSSRETYLLPFAKETNSKLLQSYAGPYGHQGHLEFAYDFQMPMGTPVLAARGGEVVKVVENFNNNTRKPGEENLVVIKHADGSFARYYHLTKDGALVSVGDKVTQGQQIALSGNSGASAGPHLHFDVTEKCYDWGCQTIKIEIANVKENPLKAGAVYTSSASIQPTSIEGYWEGAAVRVIRLDIFKDGANLRCRVEMPDFLNFAFPPLPVQQEGAKIKLRLPMTGEFLLTHEAQFGELRGAFSGQQGLPITIHFKRGVKPAEVSINEEVQFTNGDIKLTGTLIKPLTDGQHPVIVWLSGRGSSTRQDSPTLRLLAQHGIASLIYDKRGSGQSTGNFAKASFDELVSDAIAAVRVLSQRKDINAKQIGLHGSSAGGWVAPAVATQSKMPVAFIMTTVGPAENLYDQQLHAYQYYVRTGGFELTKEEIELTDEHIRKRLRLAFKNEGRDEFLASSEKIKGTRMARFLLDSEANDASDFDWLRRNDCDPVPHLKKIKAPFLAFYGTRDYIVPPAENAKKLEQFLTEAGNKDFKIVVLQNADHSLLLPNTERRDGADANAKSQFIWGSVPQEYLQTMLDWLLTRVTIVQKR